MPDLLNTLIHSHGLPLLRFCQRSGLNINPGAAPDAGIRRLVTVLMYNGEDDLLATLLRMPGANLCARLPGMTGDGLLLELLNCLPSLSNSVLALLTHPHLEVNTPDRKNETPLMKVIRHGHLPLAQALLARLDLRLADATDNEGRTLLIQMASKGDSAWVTALLCRSDCAINAACRQGNNALMAAATQGHVSVGRILLQDGRQCVNQVNRQGLSALWLALAHPDILPNAASLWGTTPLLTACEQGQRKTVALLLDHPRLYINAADCRGRTPLMAAAENSHRAIVRQLLRRRETASDLIDWAGLGAIDYAVRSGHYTIASLIRQRGVLGGVAQLWAISYFLLN